MEKGRLFVVALPIGNLKDITLRAIEVLREVKYVVCEDTRSFKKLTSFYELGSKKLFSFYKGVEGERVESVRKLGVIMGDNVKTGIQVSFMPGVKVGSNCWIGASCLINRDVESNTFVYKKEEKIIKTLNNTYERK